MTPSACVALKLWDLQYTLSLMNHRHTFHLTLTILGLNGGFICLFSNRSQSIFSWKKGLFKIAFSPP